MSIRPLCWGAALVFLAAGAACSAHRAHTLQAPPRRLAPLVLPVHHLEPAGVYVVRSDWPAAVRDDLAVESGAYQARFSDTQITPWTGGIGIRDYVWRRFQQNHGGAFRR